MSNSTASNQPGNWAKTDRPAPPAHDPIAIAALIATLPELEAAVAVQAKACGVEATKMKDILEALNNHQGKIDAAISAFKGNAPNGSRWKRLVSHGAVNLQELQQIYSNPLDPAQLQHLMNQVQKAEHEAKMAPPPMIPGSGRGWT